ncbi:hypothetical protein SEUCBS140593_000212 [Sporothrix eucalyptigena]|uniref:CUE domain-containing protein n=1 Tax=Sporothrix eucalyptigena TaxID=1812306 RepID=A0ABP0AM15_9PEZI
MGSKMKKKAKAPQKTEDEQLEELVKQYGELVEESLIILIFKEQGYQKANEALADLSQDVRLEEATGFDPSGLQGAAGDSALESSEGSSYHTPVEDPSQIASTSDYGSGSASGSQYTPLSGAALEDWRAVANDLPTDGSSTLAILKDAFPTLKDSDIMRVLKEKGDDVDKASDVLLNLEHLEQTGQRAKGIDAFFQPEDEASARNANKKRKNKDASLQVSKTGIPLALNYKLAPMGLDGADDIDDGSSLAKGGPTRAQREAIEQQQRWWQAGGNESDQLVAQQSTDTKIDLHHVIVRDGVRIALERTRYWWAHLGEDRIRKAREDPLQVVTGIGLHSPRGYSRMYGAVGTALVRDGWKVQPGPGHYYVSGKK